MHLHNKIKILGPRINRRGFSLIELMISISLSSTVIILATSFIFFLRSHERKFDHNISCTQNIFSAANVMSKEIRQADDINTSSSSNRLIIHIDPDTIIYELSAGKIKRTKNSSAQYITEDDSVGSMIFSYPAHDSVSFSIKPEAANICLTEEFHCRN